MPVNVAYPPAKIGNGGENDCWHSFNCGKKQIKKGYISFYLI